MTTTFANPSAIRTADYAPLILRVTMGVLFLAHAYVKLFIFTPAGTAGYFQSIGLPGFLAYLTIAAELLGGVALIVGYKTRIVAAALVPLMLGVVVFGHGANGFFFNNANGGWEYPLFWTVALVAQALLGSGAYSLDNRN